MPVVLKLKHELERFSGIEPGSRGTFGSNLNPIMVIGEDDDRLHMLLYRGGQYFSVDKHDEDEMKLITITDGPLELPYVCRAERKKGKSDKISDVALEEIIKLRESGLQWKAIARHFDIHYDYLMRRVNAARLK